MHTTYARPLLFALLFQLLFISFVGACCMDLGQSFRACVYASIGYWAGVAVILIRRPRAPTKSDLQFIRWGWMLIVPLGGAAFRWVWSLHGY